MTPEEHEPEHDPLAPEPTDADAEAEAAAEADSNIEQLHTQEEKDEEVSADRAEIEALTAQLATTKDQMLRVAAEAENTKRRALKEREDAQKYAITSFARSLLSVADNLRRALDSVPTELAEEDPRVKSLLDGIEGTERELLKAFELNNIKKLDPTDELFNPNFHEVMFEAPGTGKPAGTIIEILEMGYLLHDRLIRPARVGVAKEEGEPGSQLDEQV